MKRILFCILILVFTFSLGRAEVGVGMGFSPDMVAPDKDKDKYKKPKPVNIYIRGIAQYFDWREAELLKLSNHGYGRNELIKIILISKRSHTELKEIIKQREKGAKFADLTKKYNLDYQDIINDAGKVRNEVDFKIAVSSASVLAYSNDISTDTVKASTASFHQELKTSTNSVTGK